MRPPRRSPPLPQSFRKVLPGQLRFLSSHQKPDKVICDLIDRMHGSARSVCHYVESVEFIAVYHIFKIKRRCRQAAPSEASYLSLRCSQCWFATLQEVLLADWHDVWHSPHPPVVFDSAMSLVVIVLILFIVFPPFSEFSCRISPCI